MATYEDYRNIIKAFEIFERYDHEAWVGAFHDELRAGPSPASVTVEDKNTLSELGWENYDDISFTYFT